MTSISLFGVTLGERSELNGDGVATLTAKVPIVVNACKQGNGGGGGGSSSSRIRIFPAESPIRVMFAAGGTGGHVFPAIAIADALTTAYNFVSVQFVGTKHRIEASAVPRAGYPLHHIPAVPLHRPILLSSQNLLLPVRVILCVLAAIRLILHFRPHLVVGTGGYVSGPICIAAFLCGCPYVIQEQNAYPGLANKMLASFAVAIFVAFADAVLHFPQRKCIVCGNPVRATLQKLVPKTMVLHNFFPDAKSMLACDASPQDDSPCEVILIQGGSLGAKSINQSAAGFVKRMLDKNPQRFVIWQTGSKHFRDVVDKIGCHERLFISEFLHDMKLAYSAADLVVTCAGAITCSELLILGKPSILVPLHYVVDNHQKYNATVLQQAGASRVLDDIGLTPMKLETAIDELLGNKVLLASMGQNALQAAAPHAAEVIAREVLFLAEKHVLKKHQVCKGGLGHDNLPMFPVWVIP